MAPQSGADRIEVNAVRERLLSAAIAEVIEQGTCEVSFANLCGRAMVSKVVARAEFGTVDDLLLASAAELAAGAFASIGDASSREDIQMLSRAFLQQFEDNREFYRVMMTSRLAGRLDVILDQSVAGLNEHIVHLVLRSAKLGKPETGAAEFVNERSRHLVRAWILQSEPHASVDTIATRLQQFTERLER